MAEFPAPTEGIAITQFLTPPIDHGQEIRCYIRDPDGHLIEVGQLVGRVED